MDLSPDNVFLFLGVSGFALSVYNTWLSYRHRSRTDVVVDAVVGWEEESGDPRLCIRTRNVGTLDVYLSAVRVQGSKVGGVPFLLRHNALGQRVAPGDADSREMSVDEFEYRWDRTTMGIPTTVVVSTQSGGRYTTAIPHELLSLLRVA